jgi:hypothetical protein
MSLNASAKHTTTNGVSNITATTASKGNHHPDCGVPITVHDEEEEAQMVGAVDTLIHRYWNRGFILQIDGIETW